MNTFRGWLFYIALAVTIIFLTLVLLIAKPFMSLRARYEKICRPGRSFRCDSLNGPAGSMYAT